MTDYKAQEKWRKANPDKVAQMGKDWVKANPEKVKEKAKRYRTKNRYKINENKRAWSKTSKAKALHKVSGQKQRDKARAFLNELKDKPCMDCGNSFPPECMDFDHVRGEKVAHPGNMYMWSKERLLEEIGKCDLVCSNCHRIRTFRRKNEKVSS